MKLFYIPKLDRFALKIGEDTTTYSIRKNHLVLHGERLQLSLIDGELCDAVEAAKIIIAKYIGDTATTEQLAARIVREIEEKSPRLFGWVSTFNKASKAVFEKLIGRKLKTNKECDAAVREFLGEEILAKMREAAEQKAKEQAAREEEHKKKQRLYLLESLPARWDFAGRQGSGTVAGMIRAAIESGLAELEAVKAGCATRYRLSNGTRFFKLKNKQWAEFAKDILAGA